MFWSSIGLVGKQASILVFSLVLARMLGPDAYGIVAQAAVYMTLTTLLLDQGISAALIKERKVSRNLAGAAVSVNIGLAALLGLATWFLAPLVSDFFATPQLTEILRILGAALVLKAICIVPRLLLARSMNFKAQSLSDAGSALFGGLVALGCALLGAGYWSLVIQTVATDLFAAIALAILAKPPRPNLQFRLLRETMGFSTRALLSSLISYSVQNVDNVLVGKFIGPIGLAQYALAYRVLTTPIQMVSQVVTRVLFPAVSRAHHAGRSVSALIARSVRSISLVTFPAMGLIAVSAAQSVPLVLGEEWLPAIPLLQILAISGARQSFTTVNTPVVLGLGRSDVALKFSLVAATVQITAIVIGLQFGTIGVAIGFTLAGFLLTPVIFAIQRRLTHYAIRAQIASLGPAFFYSVAAVASYALCGIVLPNPLAHLVVGLLAALLVYLALIRFAHKPTWTFVRTNVSQILSRTS